MTALWLSDLPSHLCRCWIKTSNVYFHQEKTTLHRPYAQDSEHFGPDATLSTCLLLSLQLRPSLPLQLLHLHHHLSTLHPTGTKLYLQRLAPMMWQPWNSSLRRTTQERYLILTRLHRFDFGHWSINRRSARWSSNSLSNFVSANINTQPWLRLDHPNLFEVKSSFFHNYAGTIPLRWTSHQFAFLAIGSTEPQPSSEMHMFFVECVTYKSSKPSTRKLLSTPLSNLTKN